MKYKNSMHISLNQYSKEMLECDAEPEYYRGYQIFHRIKSSENGGNVFDIVKDGVCVSMTAGLSGAMREIDGFLCS